jgi:hypothetical protein
MKLLCANTKIVTNVILNDIEVFPQYKEMTNATEVLITLIW